MKTFVALILPLIVMGVLIAGCLGGQTTPATVPTPVPGTLSPTATQTASFTLGDHYLQKKYSFQSEKDIRTEQIRVDNPSWGIEFTVIPLNENLQYCWFEMKVTNMNTGQTDTYGYGRENGYELNQRYAMHVTGPYTIEMRGNRVSVDVNIAKRNP
jgi:hypothetical protein